MDRTGPQRTRQEGDCFMQQATLLCPVWVGMSRWGAHVEPRAATRPAAVPLCPGVWAKDYGKQQPNEKGLSKILTSKRMKNYLFNPKNERW